MSARDDAVEQAYEIQSLIAQGRIGRKGIADRIEQYGARQRRQAIESAEKLVKDIQRCTCPATPGEARKTHEPWCPWAISAALRRLAEQETA